jgi:hypothetical protein
MSLFDLMADMIGTGFVAKQFFGARRLCGEGRMDRLPDGRGGINRARHDADGLLTCTGMREGERQRPIWVHYWWRINSSIYFIGHARATMRYSFARSV